METLLTVIGLGLLGIGPVAATLLFAAINAGVERRKLTAYTASVFVSTMVVGVALALVTDVVFDELSREISVERGAMGAIVQISLAAVLVVWLITSIRADRAGRADGTGRTTAERPESKFHRTLEGSATRFAMTGATVGMSKILDPTLIAVSVILGGTGSLVAVLAGLAIWTLVSEIALFSLYGAYLLGAEQRIVASARSFHARHRRAITQVLYVVALVLAVVLVLDAVSYFAGRT